MTRYGISYVYIVVSNRIRRRAREGRWILAQKRLTNTHTHIRIQAYAFERGTTYAGEQTNRPTKVAEGAALGANERRKAQYTTVNTHVHFSVWISPLLYSLTLQANEFTRRCPVIRPGRMTGLLPVRKSRLTARILPREFFATTRATRPSITIPMRC